MVEVGSPEDFVLSVRKMLDLLRVRENLDGGGDPTRAASERAAYTRLMELLDGFARFYTPLRRMMHATEFSSLLMLYLADEVTPELQTPGRGVLLADVNHARFVLRRIVFFTGLDIGSFPGRHGGFSLHEPGFARERRERAEREDGLLFALAVQGAERLILTFPGIDDEGSGSPDFLGPRILQSKIRGACAEQNPEFHGDSTMSPYLREIRDRNLGWIETIFHRAVPGAAREDGFSDRRGRGETLVRMLREDPARAPLVLARIRRGDTAVAALVRRAIKRCVDTAEERGYFLADGEALDAHRHDWGSERVFGVTDLEMYADCPIRFLLARVLRLEVERAVTGEMNPADRGIIIHEILARFYRERIERGEADFGPGDIEKHTGDMREVCARVCAEHAGAFEELHPVAMTVERRFIRTQMEAFLAREAEYFREEPFRPAHIEVEFGHEAGRFGPAHPPLRIEGAGEEVLVGGRIDRIDIDPGKGTPRFRIIDYKTGGQEVSIGDLQAGIALQIPLYLKAAADCIVPGFAIHDGLFYLLREMERKGYREHRKPIVGEAWEPYIGIACARSSKAAADIREGRFPTGECARNGRCEFLPLCRGGREAAGEEDGDADQ
jgi:RecB family exonuclease